VREIPLNNRGAKSAFVSRHFPKGLSAIRPSHSTMANGPRYGSQSPRRG
jgi:hypothetical protein